jgi:maltose-binding protein MalE
MAPNRLRIFILEVVLVMLMTACTSGSGGTTTVTEDSTSTIPGAGSSSTSTSQPPQVTEILVWADEIRAPVIEAAGTIFEADSGVAVEVEVMPFLEIRGAAMSAIPAGQGPDLFIDSNEGTGALAEAGIIAPLDFQGRESEFVPVAIDAFAYGGDVYGLPFVTEALGLFYNKDLVQQPPADFESLRAMCDGLGFPTADGLPCLAIPAGEPRHQFPFVAGFGGYVFGFGDRAYDVTDIGIGSSEAIAGATFLSNLYRDGYASSAVDYSAMADLFNQGAVPFMWTGPWQVDAVDAAGVNYGVAKLPTMSGNPPRPLVGSQGFFLNAVTEKSEAAMSFLLDYIAAADTMAELASVTNRPPTLLSTLDELGGHPNVVAFAQSASDGLPLPNVAEMDAVWGPLGEAFAALDQGNGDPAAIMGTADGLVRAAVGAG